MDYYIQELCDNNSNDWEKLCEESKEGTFFHSLKWKRILEGLNYRNHCFLLYRNDEPVALCPFYEATIKGFRGLVSLPISDYDHIIVKDRNDPTIAYRILEKCKEIAKKNKLFFIHINTLNKTIKENFNKYSPLPYPIGGNMVLNLDKIDPGKIWSEIFSKKDRKYISRFEKDGYRIEEIESIDNLKIFYKYYKANIEHINATPYPYTHFEDLLKIFSPRDMRITLLYKNENVAGGQLSFLYDSKKTMYLRYLSLNRNLPIRYSPTSYLRWNSIKKASRMGYNRICFGRTPHDSKDIHYKLKEMFGCQYEIEHSLIFPTSYLFKIGYNIYYNIYGRTSHVN